MNLARYSPAFKEEVVRKMLIRGDRTIADMAAELNVPYHSVRNWLRNPKIAHLNRPASSEKRAQEWSAEQRLQALLDTNNLSPEELNAWCRERGIFTQQLQAWRAEFCMPTRPAADATEVRKLKGELATLQRELNRKEKALSEAAALLVLQKKVPGDVGGRGQMTSLAQRQNIMLLIDQAVGAGARQACACEVIGLSARTLQRWQADRNRGDRRPQRIQVPHNRYSELERQRILSVVNSDEYGHLPPSQIVPRLADKGLYVASESTMYRLLRAAGQLSHRGRQRARQPLPKPRALSAGAPNQIYSWDITYLPAAVKGQFHYLYLFLDLFSRKIVGWQVYDTEDSLAPAFQ